MTLKSQARLKRDEIAKIAKNSQKEQKNNTRGENKCWDDLSAISQASATALMGIDAQFEGLGENSVLLSYIVDKEKFFNHTRMMNSDIQTLTGELNNIRKVHETRKGGSTNDDDLFYCVDLQQQYVKFNLRVEALVFPVAAVITEMVDHASRRMHYANDVLQDNGDSEKITTVDFVETPVVAA